MNGVKKLACGVVLSVAVAFGAANAWADPATSYVSVGSGDATIVDLGDQFAVVFSNAQASATLTSLRDCYLMRSLVVGGGGGGAGTAGENPGLHVESVLYGDETDYRAQAGYGGEGVTNDISGVNEVYGSDHCPVELTIEL